MTSPGGVGAARGDAPTPQDAAAERRSEAEIRADLALILAALPYVDLLPTARVLGDVPALLDALARVEALAEKWAHATDSLTGQRSLVTWAFAMEVRAALAAAGPVPVAADVPTPSAATQNEAQR